MRVSIRIMVLLLFILGKGYGTENVHSTLNISLILDSASLLQIGDIPRKINHFKSKGFNDFQLSNSMAIAGFSLNYFFDRNYGLDFSMLVGKLHVYFNDELPCRNAVSIEYCTTTDNNSLVYAEVENYFLGPIYKISLGEDFYWYKPNFIRVGGGYFLYTISYEKGLTSQMANLQMQSIQNSANHGLYFNIDFDFYFMSNASSFSNLPRVFLTIGLGLRHNRVTMPGQSVPTHEWLYSIPIKFGISF